jgi:hypothetical protein
VSSDAEAARKIVLDCETRLNAAGADRTKVKYEIYKELKAKGLDEDAELLMTFDVVTRANSGNSAPQAGPDLQAAAEHPVPPEPQQQPPHPRRPWKRYLATALPLALLILVGVRLGPYFYSLLVNHFSPVVVPVSHFVGQHGKNKRLIVFVHGVMGDMDNTWLNPVTHSSWPELITDDQDLSQFDVFVYGYASPAMGNSSTISEISTRFLQQLTDRGLFVNYTQIDFITHSMGGIITKRMLDMLNTPSDSPFLQKVHTVIYISVPSNGADLAALASWISQNPQFKGMDDKNASDFLQSVESDWANLLRQRTAELPFPRTYSAYETLPTGPVKVVPQLYTSELSDGRVIGFDYNHIDIVKPKDRNAEVYLWTKARLLEKTAEPQPIPKQHTHVDFVTPLPTQGDLFLPYRKGETPSINVRYRNGGDFPIRDGRMKVKIITIPFSENSIVFRKYRNKLNAESSTILGVSNSHSNIGYHTYYGPALSDEDVTKLNNAEEVLCAIGILDWRDDSGRYETDIAQCVMAEQPVAVGIFNWHVGAENNGEHKLL